jgi:putative RNA 2'-phosphotransferase
MSKKADRFLSLILRHKPESAGIILDKNGWTNVDVLISKLQDLGYDIDDDILYDIVDTNDKQRFKFSEDYTKIRASQGHSVDVDLQLKSQVPPVVLYHGTVESALKGIFKDGLKRVKRHAVHLSHETVTATKVGSRRGDAIILEIDSKKMYADGIKFYKSENGVWLVEEVPPKYIKKI